MNVEEHESYAIVRRSLSDSILHLVTAFNANTIDTISIADIKIESDCGDISHCDSIDFSDCVASTNENSLKVLSLLDFAGQSAYYACHHIFFSPRAFYILVVDMSKDLKSHADRACDKEGFIYSDWTYAGRQITQSIKLHVYIISPNKDFT